MAGRARLLTLAWRLIGPLAQACFLRPFCVSGANGLKVQKYEEGLISIR